MATSSSDGGAALAAPIPYSEIPNSTGDSTGPNGSHGTYNPVDSALLSAMRDPRERLALLKLEQLLLDFCDGGDEWLEVGGPYNSISVGPSSLQERGVPIVNGHATSFHRCVLHRLADRFSIVRTNGGVIEGSIRLIKIPESRVPTSLLRDLDPAEYAPPPPQSPMRGAPDVMGLSNAMSQASVDPTGSSSNSNQTDTPQQQPPRKMKIMKRSDRGGSGTPNDKKKGNPKTLLQKNSSVSDKEKAYAEARARIFNDDSDAGNSNSGAQGDDTASASVASAAAAAASAAVSTTPPPAAASGAQSPLRRLPSNEGSSTAASLAKRDAAVAGSSSLENKAVYRNRMEEAADPDFRRGVVVYPVYYPSASPAAAAAAGAAGAANATATSYASRAASQQQQQQPPATNTMQQQQQNNASYYHAKPMAPPAAPPKANCMESFPPLTADAPAFYPKAASPSRPPPSASSVQR